MTTRHAAIRHASALIIGCSVLVLGLGLDVRSAHADSCGVPPDVMIVLDRSGSMAELAGNQSKWTIAKSAVNQLTANFGAQLKLGMMLLPQFPDADACGAGEVNVAPSLTTQGSIASLLSSAYPKGNTPLASSLDQVLAHLKAKSWVKAPKVILITDGKETCRSAPAPLDAGGTCQWDNGTNYRKCGGCGWQFCLKSGSWSSACAPAPTIFPCAASQTCGANAQCVGPTSGSATPQQAAQALEALGINTYVVGFGAEIDAAALTAIAKAGGTALYHQADNLTQLSGALNAIAQSISCCGNGALDAGELCDPDIAAGLPGACAVSCDDGDPCTVDLKEGVACNVSCSHTSITKLVNGDGCCPTGANSGNDSDCQPSCGNGVLDAGEACDPGIAPGQPGACDASCDDGNACTVDVLGGSACNPSCTHTAAVADPSRSDGCCPKDLTFDQDADCLPLCTPDRTTDCIDPCRNVNCPDGQFCAAGSCEAWPEDTSAEGTAVDGGCDCRLGGGSNASGASLSLLLLLFVLVARRRRRRLLRGREQQG